MERKPELPSGEAEVLSVVWKLGEATAREVFDAYPNERAVEFETVRTVLRRLAQKRYLRTKRRNRAIYYTPRVSQESVVKTRLREMIRKLFHGQPAPLFQQLLDLKEMSKSDLKEIRSQIDNMLKDDDDPES